MRRTARSRLLGSVAGGLVAVLGLASCSATSTSAPPPSPTSQAGSTTAPTVSLQRFYDQKPAWKACGGGFYCTTVEVPLNYQQPDAGTIGLSVIKLPAQDQAHRLGSLLVNPGGPGGSGVDYARAADRAFTLTLLKSYDIVGFDPRGVASSDPVKCLSDKQLDTFIAIDGSPDTPAEEQALVAVSKGFANGCEQRSGRLLPYVGTVDAAKDMDIIRAVVGDAKLNYFGASYGTFLGATYAEEFPTRVGRMVLDGAIDPAIDAVELGKGQAEGFQLALDDFLKDCFTHSDCPVGPDEATAQQQIVDLLARADKTPLSGSRPVTQSLALLGIVFAMYAPEEGWPVLRQALARALQGDGSILLQLADLYTDRASDGHYTSNQNEVIYAVNCVDRADHSTLAQIRGNATDWTKISPVFGAYLAWSNLPCTMWPVPATDQAGPIHAAGAPPILVVGTTRDPATPYAWAQGLASELDSGRLLTYVGDGHTAYNRGSQCIDSAVDGYLTQGTLPPVGTRCT